MGVVAIGKRLGFERRQTEEMGKQGVTLLKGYFTKRFNEIARIAGSFGRRKLGDLCIRQCFRQRMR